MTQNRELWLGFLLGANDEHEDQIVKDHLAQEPKLHEQLATLRQHLELLDDGLDHEEPPAGLADRTCKLLEDPAVAGNGWSSVADSSPNSQADAPTPSRSAAKMSGRPESLSGGNSWFSFMDGLVAVGVCLAALAIFFPALAGSRMLASRVQCQDNLRQVGAGLHKFADASSRQRYPAIQAAGPLSVAGAYAPRLVNEGWIPNPEVLSCVNGANPVAMPTVEQLLVARESVLPELHEQLAGVFNYNLGIRQGDDIEAPKMAGRARFPIASDVVLVDGEIFSSNSHFENRVNILFDDGHVEFLKIDHLPPDMQRVFVNNEGLVQAGLDEDDVVLANSIARPIPNAPLTLVHGD